MKGLLPILIRNRAALFGAVTLAFFVLVAAMGPMLMTLDLTPEYAHRFQSPGLDHLLGTDYAGRDTLAELVYGSRDIMMIAFSTAAIATLVAVSVGAAAALLGGWFDAAVGAVIDVFLTVPQFPVMAILAALFRISTPLQFGLVLALFAWPGLARAIRAQIVSITGKEFIEVCRVMAMGPLHIMFNELLPNIMPFITVNFITIAKDAIAASVGITMLGLVPLRVQNWGMMLNMAAFQTGAIFIPHAYAYLLSPMVAIVLFQYGLVQFAGGIDELFDARLRRY